MSGSSCGRGALSNLRMITPHVVSTDITPPGATTATRAAAAGGVTTLVDMPLNSVPTTTTAQLLLDKIAAVKVRL
jgi:dihydroorotase-like cyclic amidohydrolase